MGKNVIIVTPYWDDNEHHPHRRRISWWISFFAEMNYQVLVLGLGPQEIRRDQGRVNWCIHSHPHTSNGKKSQLHVDVDFDVLTRLYHLVSTEHLPQTAIVLYCLPKVAGLLDRMFDRRYSIVDIHDVPQPSSDNSKDSLNKIHEFRSSLDGRHAITLSKQENQRLRETTKNTLSTLVCPPMVSVPVENNKVPSFISFWGRKCSDTAQGAKWIYDELFTGVSTLGLRLNFVGEGSTLWGTSNSRVTCTGSVDDLAYELANGICLLPGLKTHFGLSFRVLDAVESGAPMIGQPLIFEGHGLQDTLHYYSANNSREYLQRIEEILSTNNYGRDRTVAAYNFLRDRASKGREDVCNLLQSMRAS